MESKGGVGNLDPRQMLERDRKVRLVLSCSKVEEGVEAPVCLREEEEAGVDDSNECCVGFLPPEADFLFHC